MKYPVEEGLLADPVTPYSDPALSTGDGPLRLGVRMWMSGMLRETHEVCDEMALFTVVKKVENEGGEQRVTSQRLVFDERAENEGWLPPPSSRAA